MSVGTDIWVQDSNLDIAHYSWPAGVSDWNLVFKKARVEDSGLYECKVITTEKMVWQVRLTVLGKKVSIYPLLLYSSPTRWEVWFLIIVVTCFQLAGKTTVSAM